VIEIRAIADIARPPEEVFAYLADPAKLTTWQNADEVTQLTPGPVGVGTRFREVHRALGRRRVETTEIVTFEPGRRFEIRVIDGPPVDGRWDFEPAAGGTRLIMTPTARVPGPLRPLVELATALVMQRFHRRLERALVPR
jgi:uncharacterized protein YndB with AHSA1/START domain